MNRNKECLYDPMFPFKAAQFSGLSSLPLFLLGIHVLYQQNGYNGLSDLSDAWQNNIVPFSSMNRLGTQLQEATAMVMSENK